MRRWTADPAAYKLFHQATVALSQIEANGIRVDEDYLERAMSDTSNRIEELQKELKADPVFKTWKKRFGDKTKLGSHPQLAEVVFTELGHKRKKGLQTEDGKESANEAAFADVDIPFVKNWFRLEKLRKSLGTYLTGIHREVVNGYIHPNFNLHFAVTYRSSSDNPNFQNIPKRNKEMTELIRRCYIPRPGFMLGEIDFSGAEVRVSACYNKDPKLIRYIEDPTTDMHRDTACDIFCLKPEEVDKKGPRDAAKNMFVFPQFYGSVYFQCAPHMWEAMLKRKFQVVGSEELVKDRLASKGIKRLGDCEPGGEPRPGSFAHHVREVEKSFWEKRFKVYSQWKRDYFNEYLRTGGFQMYTGFVCHGVFKRNDVLNYAIQGSAFHCLLWSLVQIQRWLIRENMETKIVGQIHDSIVADIHPDEKDDFLAKCKQIMTVDLLKHWPWLIVPMLIEAELSQVDGNWFELKAVDV